MVISTVSECFRILYLKNIFIFIHFSAGNGRDRKPALCQLYRHTFVPCRIEHYLGVSGINKLWTTWSKWPHTAIICVNFATLRIYLWAQAFFSSVCRSGPCQARLAQRNVNASSATHGPDPSPDLSVVRSPCLNTKPLPSPGVRFTKYLTIYHTTIVSLS